MTIADAIAGTQSMKRARHRRLPSKRICAIQCVSHSERVSPRRFGCQHSATDSARFMMAPAEKLWKSPDLTFRQCMCNTASRLTRL